MMLLGIWYFLLSFISLVMFFIISFYVLYIQLKKERIKTDKITTRLVDYFGFACVFFVILFTASVSWSFFVSKKKFENLLPILFSIIAFMYVVNIKEKGGNVKWKRLKKYYQSLI